MTSLLLLCLFYLLTLTATASAPDHFVVRFETTASLSPSFFRLSVDRKYAPLGVDRFYELVKEGYYDNSAFFRYVPNFVVQFGIAGDPAISRKWINATIPDDPVLLSNTVGTIAFATGGPNTRTTQVYINFRDNSRLDKLGFSAFGNVTEGMEVARGVYAGYGELPDQDTIYEQGNSYLHKSFPLLTYITRCIIES
eukprot:TRINITY_DN1393_c0_g1_i1.p1 TRINITY_DN1393_c0_g1~~TRINITY_DN1393_c0_g1_i1.p1  ORF type:complete len:196 (+),score=43.08 TRINITY_DN1393_c0_g1_i1:160-747(+)